MIRTYELREGALYVNGEKVPLHPRVRRSIQEARRIETGRVPGAEDLNRPLTPEFTERILALERRLLLRGLEQELRLSLEVA